MATRIKPKTKELYRKDFYVWALEQADRLRAKRFDTLDLDNLIEEVEGLADVQRSAVLNNARAIMEHLLKLEHCPPPTRARAGELPSSSTAPASRSS
jgi:hypothetical protein